MRRQVFTALAVVVGVAVAAPVAFAQEAPPPPPSETTPAPTTPTTAGPAVPPVETPTTPADPLLPAEPGATTPLPGFGDEPAPDTPPLATPDEGSGGLLQGPDLRRGQSPTLYEQYGTGGYGLDSDFGIRDTGDKLNNFWAGVFWSMTIWVSDLSAKVLQWAFSVDIFVMAGDAVDEIVGALTRTLYQPFLLTFVVLAGLWLSWQTLLRRRALLAGEATLWVITALMGGSLLLANPSAVTNGANKVTTGLSRMVLAAVSGVDPKTGPDDGVTIQGGFSGDAADAQLRASADRFWRTMVYKPWLAMEFGDAEKGEQWGQELLAAKALDADEAAQARNDPARAKQLEEKNKAEYDQIVKEIKEDPQAKEWFNGHQAQGRVRIAAMSLFSASVAGALLMILAGSILFAQLMMLLLVMLAPIFLLAAVQPGPGRQLGMRWLSLVLGLAFKRVAYSALLAVVLVISGVFVDQGSKLGWGVAMALQVATTAAVFIYRKPLLGLLQQVGHPTGWGMTTGTDSPGRKGAGIAGGVVGGVALSRLLRRDAPLPSPAAAGRSGGGETPSPPAGGRRPAPSPNGSTPPAPPAASAGTTKAAASTAGASGTGGATAAGQAGAAAGAVLAGMAAKRGADQHRGKVGQQLTGDLDGVPNWPESNRSGQPLPLPVILERQRQRRDYRDWHQQGNGSDSPEVPRRKDGDE